jgi:hypothetical protein
MAAFLDQHRGDLQRRKQTTGDAKSLGPDGKSVVRRGTRWQAGGNHRGQQGIRPRRNLPIAAEVTVQRETVGVVPGMISSNDDRLFAPPCAGAPLPKPASPPFITCKESGIVFYWE